MNKYLLLGGNGFIGSYLKRELSKNSKVLVLGRNLPEPMEKNENIFYNTFDFSTCNDFSDFLTGIDTVYHLISMTRPNEKIESIEDDLKNDVIPTLKLLKGMIECGVKNIVFISSGGCVYGEQDKLPIKEDSIGLPICSYGINKELIEKYLFLYNKYYGINYKIVRLSNPYSIDVNTKKVSGFIPTVIEKIINNEDITIWGDGSEIRDYIYIDDAIDAIRKIELYEGKERIFNVGTGVGYSNEEIIKIICDLIGNCNNLKIVNIPRRKCDVEANILDISKIKNECNWVPKYSIQEGVKKILSIKKQR